MEAKENNSSTMVGKIKYSLAYYAGIGENPLVILLDREVGAFNRQYNTIEELKSSLGENPTVYFVADGDDKRIDNLNSWHGQAFDFEKLLNL